MNPYHIPNERQSTLRLIHINFTTGRQKENSLAMGYGTTSYRKSSQRNGKKVFFISVGLPMEKTAQVKSHDGKMGDYIQNLFASKFV
jgi:hypothetical protein